MPGRDDVVDERAAPGKQAGVLDPLDPGARVAGGDSLRHGIRSPPSSRLHVTLSSRTA